MIDPGLMRKRYKILFFKGQFSLTSQAKAKRMLKHSAPFKATSHSTTFDNAMCPVREDQRYSVLPIKKGPQLS